MSLSGPDFDVERVGSFQMEWPDNVGTLYVRRSDGDWEVTATCYRETPFALVSHAMMRQMVTAWGLI